MPELPMGKQHNALELCHTLQCSTLLAILRITDCLHFSLIWDDSQRILSESPQQKIIKIRCSIKLTISLYFSL